VWDDPQTTFVARFIGHANVLTGPAIGLDAAAITVPTDALTLTDAGDLDVRIIDSVFIDGRYEIAVELANGERMRIDSPTAPDRGHDVRVMVDRSTVRELTVDEL
jgi:ABC-type Fe3+/spermidine/putrescine transport system ATPase subunit